MASKWGLSDDEDFDNISILGLSSRPFGLNNNRQQNIERQKAPSVFESVTVLPVNTIPSDKSFLMSSTNSIGECQTIHTGPIENQIKSPLKRTHSCQTDLSGSVVIPPKPIISKKITLGCQTEMTGPIPKVQTPTAPSLSPRTQSNCDILKKLCVRYPSIDFNPQLFVDLLELYSGLLSISNSPINNHGSSDFDKSTNFLNTSMLSDLNFSVVPKSDIPLNNNLNKSQNITLKVNVEFNDDDQTSIILEKASSSLHNDLMSQTSEEANNENHSNHINEDDPDFTVIDFTSKNASPPSKNDFAVIKSFFVDPVNSMSPTTIQLKMLAASDDKLFTGDEDLDEDQDKDVTGNINSFFINSDDENNDFKFDNYREISRILPPSNGLESIMKNNQFDNIIMPNYTDNQNGFDFSVHDNDSSLAEDTTISRPSSVVKQLVQSSSSSQSLPTPPGINIRSGMNRNNNIILPDYINSATVISVDENETKNKNESTALYEEDVDTFAAKIWNISNSMNEEHLGNIRFNSSRSSSSMQSSTSSHTSIKDSIDGREDNESTYIQQASMRQSIMVRSRRSHHTLSPSQNREIFNDQPLNQHQFSIRKQLNIDRKRRYNADSSYINKIVPVASNSPSLTSSAKSCASKSISNSISSSTVKNILEDSPLSISAIESPANRHHYFNFNQSGQQDQSAKVRHSTGRISRVNSTATSEMNSSSSSISSFSSNSNRAAVGSINTGLLGSKLLSREKIMTGNTVLQRQENIGKIGDFWGDFIMNQPISNVKQNRSPLGQTSLNPSIVRNLQNVGTNADLKVPKLAMRDFDKQNTNIRPKPVGGVNYLNRTSLVGKGSPADSRSSGVRSRDGVKPVWLTKQSDVSDIENMSSSSYNPW